MYPSLLRPLLFHLEPETIHSLTLQLLRAAGFLPPVRTLLRAAFAPPDHHVDVFSLQFRNPIGLAAGYDKDALAWRGLEALGFGHLELGTVTLRPQKGNPPPRVFRLQEQKALINRLGFPSRGAEFVCRRLASRRRDVVIGINLGKNAETTLESAASDYVSLVRIFAALADYLAINVSSPNTVGLRRLQARAALEELLQAVQQERRMQGDALAHNIPVLVKISPDLDNNELDDVLDVVSMTGMDGVIATNTTIGRDGIPGKAAYQTGGLSGTPLFERSLEVVRKIYQRTSGGIPIIGVGGIMDARGAVRMLDAGASLIQVYTGLVYEGPGLLRDIGEALSIPRFS